MHTSLSKKLLAGLLSLVMVLSLVAPSTSAQAATKYSLTDKKSVKSGVTFKYELKGVSKGCYVKVTRNVSGEKVVYNKKELTKTTKVNGTGKTLNLYVTYGEKDENYTGKFTVKVYGKKTNKLYKTLVEEVTVKVPEKEPEEPEVVELAATAKQTGAKQITVTFNKDVKASEPTITVARGTNSASVSSVEWTSNDTAVLTMGANVISDNKYTVSVVAGEDKAEAEFDGETSKVSSIKILSDKAIKTASTADSTVSVKYGVYNQYGEDLTKSTAVTITSNGGANASTKAGVYTSTTATFDTTIDKLLTISIVDPTTGVSATATLDVTDASYVAELTCVGLYNKDNLTLDEDVNLSKTPFYVEFTGKDQYGNTIDLCDYEGTLLFSETNTTVMTFAKQSSGANTVADFEYLDSEQTRFGVRITSILKPGTSTLLLTSMYNGAQGTYAAKVEEARRVYSVVMNQPEVAIAGESVYIPFNVYDANGDEITTLATVKDSSKGVSFTSGNVLKKDGKFYLMISSVAEAYVSVTAQALTSYKTNTITVHINKPARPVAIVGYTGATANNTGANDTTSFKVSNLKVEDQYGRILNKNSAAWANLFNYAATSGNIRVVASVDDAASVAVLKVNNAAQGVDAAFTDNTTALLITYVADGVGKITLSLQQHDGSDWVDLRGSEYTLKYVYTDDSEYVSYTAEVNDTIYVNIANGQSDNETTAADDGEYFGSDGVPADNSYNRAVVVYGVLENGSKVELTNNTHYSLSSPNAKLNNDLSDGIIGDSLDFEQADFGYDENGKDIKTLKTSVDVSINATTEVITLPVTFSSEAPKVVAFEAYNSAFTGSLVDYDVQTWKSTVAAQDVIDSGYVWAIDQYGVYSYLNGKTMSSQTFTANTGTGSATTKLNGRCTVTKTSGTVNVTGNGTASAVVTSASAGATADFTFAFGNATMTVSVLFEAGVGANTMPAAEKAKADANSIKSELESRSAANTGNVYTTPLTYGSVVAITNKSGNLCGIGTDGVYNSNNTTNSFTGVYTVTVTNGTATYSFEFTATVDSDKSNGWAASGTTTPVLQ